MTPDTFPPDLDCLFAAGFDLIRIKPCEKLPLDAGWRRLSVSHSDILQHMTRGGNVGWRIGPADLVIDVDPRNFAEGDDPLGRLCRDTGLVLDYCPHVFTGSGGHHYYLTKPADASTVDSHPDYPGIEFKTLGRQVVVPGSIHPNGTRYQWDDFAPAPADRPRAPETFLNMIRRPEQVSSSGGGELTPEQLSDCLGQLNIADYKEHDRWLALMMACHHATAGEGRFEFVNWSITDPEYAQDAVMIGRRWDSLHADKGTGVTFRTLYKEVLDAGGTIPQDSPESDFAQNPASVEEVLRPEVARLQEMNEKHCLVHDGAMRVYNKIYNPVFRRYHYQRFTRHDFQMLYENTEIDIAGIKSTKANWWMRQPKRREYQGITFAPNKDVTGYLNLWQGYSVKANHAPWGLFDSFIFETICDMDSRVYDYVMNWYAHLIQQPGEPAEVALVLRGAKGVGKGTFCTAAMELLRAHAIQVSSAQHFVGRFNAHLRDCVLLFVDEAFWAGDHAAESTLKRLITEKTLVYEGKGVDAISDKNCLSVMIASNADWVVPAGMDNERRFAVLDIKQWREGKEKQKYFDDIHKQFYDEGGIGGFFQYLLDRDIAGWHPRQNVPQTMALAEQKLEGLTEIQEWWLERLIMGVLPGQRSDWSFGTDCPTYSLHEHYMNETGSRNYKNRRSSQSTFGRRMKKLVPKYKVEQKERLSDELVPGDTRGRVRVVSFPNLTICREFFEKQLGIKLNWSNL